MREPRYSGVTNPRRLFLEGPFGAGKTAYALETLAHWLTAGAPPDKILVLVPQRSLGTRYLHAIRAGLDGITAEVEIRTVGGLAQEAVLLYWPYIARKMGFAHPTREPQLLTIETAQYAMSTFVTQAVREGEFAGISITPQQIARQIIDNLGKAAILRVDYQQIPDLLKSAWGIERPAKRRLVYEAAGRVATRYRDYCYANNLLDHALQLEGYAHLLSDADLKGSLLERKSYLIAEHIEEENAFTHDLLWEWLPRCEAALLTYEWDGGFRVFLGADPQGGYALKSACDGALTFHDSPIPSDEITRLSEAITAIIQRKPDIPLPTTLPVRAEPVLFIPEMIDRVTEEIGELIATGVPPDEIAILAPYLSDALQFLLVNKLSQAGIASLAHRPSRALRDEPAAKAILTLAKLCANNWGDPPPMTDVALALSQVIDGLDPVRADLLTRIVYRNGRLGPFTAITDPDTQEKITFTAGERYNALRDWLEAEKEADPTPPDHLVSRLYSEVLSQPGYGYHADVQAGRIIAELVESATKFRQSLYPDGLHSADMIAEMGERYFSIIEQGLLGGTYLTSWENPPKDSVLIAPAYTFLMRDRAVSYQFWLNAGANGWWERLEQPLSHPYVLSREWQKGRVWTDIDEQEKQEEMLLKVMTGLLRRCRRGITLGISEFSEQGYEQRGPVLRIFQVITQLSSNTSGRGGNT